MILIRTGLVGSLLACGCTVIGFCTYVKSCHMIENYRHNRYIQANTFVKKHERDLELLHDSYNNITFNVELDSFGKFNGYTEKSWLEDFNSSSDCIVLKSYLLKMDDFKGNMKSHQEIWEVYAKQVSEKYYFEDMKILLRNAPAKSVGINVNVKYYNITRNVIYKKRLLITDEMLRVRLRELS